MERSMTTLKAQIGGRQDTNALVFELDDGRLALVFDPKQDLGLSGSGKSHVVATAAGMIKLTNGISISFTAFRKA
jgi:ABC-type proline/glycine betaine transport system ATPase subunit